MKDGNQIQKDEWDRLPKIFDRQALHPGILVALIRGDGPDFAAYIFPVAGVDWDTEIEEWRTNGEKITYEHAKFLFKGSIEKLEKLVGRWRS